ncbi:MAG: SpoVK/Ycf46/Vps4 family AAA+-type ATPase [Cellvibrionaceae bacterium]|jgi:SpoVK/Ycf46/Vps4 family AAA+-type ATPase
MNNRSGVADLPESVFSSHSSNHYVTLWSLRIILRLSFRERFFNYHQILANFDQLQAVGLIEYFDEGSYGSAQTDKRTQDIKKMEQHLLQLEQQQPFEDDTPLSGIRLLTESLSLTETDIALFHFSILANRNNGFSLLLEMLGELTNRQCLQALTTILKRSDSEMTDAISSKSALLSSGLIDGQYIYSEQTSIRQRLVLPESIILALSRAHDNQSSLLESFFRASPLPKLSIEDYRHIESDFSLLQDYVQAAIANRSEGVNVLIYGAPGTGKTEMVRALCANANLALHEIAIEASGGRPIDGSERFVTLKLSQRLLGESSSDVLLFDEAEDVFPIEENPFFGSYRATEVKKAWVNNVLERNKVPTFWLCNHVRQIDHSYLRRFDIVLQLRPINSDVRLRIIKKYIGDLSLSDKWLADMAEQEHLVPAIVERAVKVVSLLKPESQQKTEVMLEKIIGNTLEVMSLPRYSRKKASQHTGYDLAYLNPDIDLIHLCASLHKDSHIRICLYGPPGTGKTAFAHYLADVLGKKILVKRASDILSKWVGEAEKNIAGMFEEASENNQILLLDEADSFLQERRSAGQAWEVTQVNEMLVQMETFKGVFIAATNLMGSLDAASLRRFEFKVKFDYLNASQAWSLFCQIMQENACDMDKIDTQYQTVLNKYDNLTAGDFATVIRQAVCLSSSLTPELLLEGLLKELKAKPNYSKSIGFV